MDTRQHAPGAAAAADARQPVTVRLLGGPTALIEIGGLRLLTDPAFGSPGPAADGTRTAGAPLLRGGGRGAGPAARRTPVTRRVRRQPRRRRERLLATVPVTFTTTGAADRLGGTAVGLRPWYHLTLARPDGGCLKVTATASRSDGRDGREEGKTEGGIGAVIGFVLTGPDVPTIYVGGDAAPHWTSRAKSRTASGPSSWPCWGTPAPSRRTGRRCPPPCVRPEPPRSSVRARSFRSTPKPGSSALRLPAPSAPRSPITVSRTDCSCWSPARRRPSERSGRPPPAPDRPDGTRPARADPT
ncbi:MBL fold metallo-hydrolase [Streptomyces kaempferi]